MTAHPKLHLQHDVPELLALLAERYNLEAVEFDQLAAYNDQLLAEKQADAERIRQLEQTVADQQAQLEHWEAEQQKNVESLTKAEGIARAAVAQKRQLELTTATLKAAQQELTQLKGGDNPKKLKEQIKRVKDKNTELTAKCDGLQREITLHRKEKRELGKEIDRLKKEMYIAGVKQANGSFTRLWSDGTQHIMLWPEAISVQNQATGEATRGRALLYMHQSLRGALLTLDHQTNSTQIGEAPKGGLRLTKEAKAFTDAWLYKVNALQNGDITGADLQVIDL